MTPDPIPVRSVSTLECRTCGAGAPVDEHFCPQCSRILALGRHGDYFAFLGLPRKLTDRAGRPRAPVPRAEPQVSSRLLLQRVARRAAGQPRALVVSERRLSRAAESRRAHRASARDRRTAAREVGRGIGSGQGAAGAARRSVRAERGARRDSRAARVRRRSGGARVAARGGARSRSSASARSTSGSSQELSARWDSQETRRRRPNAARRSTRCARRLLERNYINNLLATIEREVAGSLSSAPEPEAEPNRAMGKVVGIDLGTTNSLVAYVKRRRAGGDPRQLRRCAGAVGRVARRGRHDLRRTRSAAAAADRAVAHGLLREALHGPRHRRRAGRSGAAAVRRRRRGRRRRPHRRRRTASSRRRRSPRSCCAS